MNVKFDWPNKNPELNCTLSVIVSEGSYWQGATYKFSFVIPTTYPFDAPKIKCLNRIYHPNIDFEGNVCLNILR